MFQKTSENKFLTVFTKLKNTNNTMNNFNSNPVFKMLDYHKNIFNSEINQQKRVEIKIYCPMLTKIIIASNLTIKAQCTHFTILE